MKNFLKKTIKIALIKFPNIFYKFEAKEMVQDIQWIEQTGSLYLKVIKVIPYPLHIFFKSYIELINNYIVDNNYDMDTIVENWIKDLNKVKDEKKILVFNILYIANLINDNSMKALYDFANNTESKFYRYWMTMNMDRMAFGVQKGFYNNYYVDRRKLIKKIALEHDIKIKKTDAKYCLNKLCIITQWLDDSIYNSAQRVAIMLSEGLKKYYDEIAIISLDSFGTSIRDYGKITTIMPFPRSIKKAKRINKMFDKKVRVFHLKETKYNKKFQEALDYIYFYNPDAILDMSDEFSVISFYYSKDFPTYYLPMRNYVSSSFFDYIISDKTICKELNKKYSSVKENKIKQWIFPEYIPEKTKPYTRKELGFSEESFIIITMGNVSVIDEELAEYMNELLVNNKDMIWLLVGKAIVPQFMYCKYKNLFDDRRIIEWGFENNLASLCAICNVHLRVNNTGGSGATAIAAQQGLPIVMTNYICDCMRWLGYDYSKSTNWKEVINEIIKLYNDNNYYLKKQKIVLDKIKEATDFDKAWNKLYLILSGKVKE